MVDVPAVAVVPPVEVPAVPGLVLGAGSSEQPAKTIAAAKPDTANNPCDRFMEQPSKVDSRLPPSQERQALHVRE